MKPSLNSTKTNEAKSKFYQDKFCDENTNTVFKTVNNLIQPDSSRPMPSSSSGLELANSFVTFFHDKVEKIRVALDAAIVDTEEDPVDCPPTQHVLELFPPLTVQEVRNLITKSPTKSCMLDPIPTWLLKEDKVLAVLAPEITACINSSLSSGCVPDCLKSAIVTPLLKKTGLDANTFKNYRPVSNLAFLGKLMEKAVASHLTTHMLRNGLYDPFQSAYRKGHSTETALLKVKNDIDCALDRGEGVLLLLLDLSAAFDTVDHRILLKRLSFSIGVQGTSLAWLKSYLSCRSQSVNVDGAKSKEVPLTTGVPQGSVLGPLLFLCYLLPLARIIDAHPVMRHGYADDTQVYVTFKLNDINSLLHAISILEACVRDIRAWMVRNKLQLNDDKTELLLVAPKHLLARILQLDPKVSVGSAVIRPSEAVKNLGAMFDRNMDMAKQVNQVCKSVYYNIRQIGKIRRHLNSVTCATVVHALVTSRLDYNNGLLVGLPDKMLSRLQLAQNCAARLVKGVRKHDHITPVLRSLHWLPVKQRITYKILILAYKVVHSVSPPDYLVSLLQLHTSTRALRSSNKAMQLAVPRVNKTVGDRAFSSAAPRLWNGIDCSLRQISSLETFKKHLKTLLFSDYFLSC